MTEISSRSAAEVAHNGSPAKIVGAQRLTRGLGRDLLTVSGLATICTCIGLASNLMRDQPLPLIYASKQARLQQFVTQLDRAQSRADVDRAQIVHSAATPSEDRTPRSINLEEFRSLVEDEGCMALDARPEIFHRLGHVPGAISLSRDDFETAYAKQRTLLEPLRDKTIVVYCSSPKCEDSQMVADALVKLGYQRVLVFKGGWEEWKQAGLSEKQS